MILPTLAEVARWRPSLHTTAPDLQISASACLLSGEETARETFLATKIAGLDEEGKAQKRARMASVVAWI